VLSGCRGDAELARKYLAKVPASEQSQAPYDMALAYAYVHAKDAALSSLEQAAAARQSAILNIRYEPMFDEIRTEPRFVALEKMMGLK